MSLLTAQMMMMAHNAKAFEMFSYVGNGAGNRVLPTTIDMSNGGFYEIVQGGLTVAYVVSHNGATIYKGTAWGEPPNLTNPAGYSMGSNTIGVPSALNTAATTYYVYCFRRKKGFCDVVRYTGTGANLTLNHSLGAIPLMLHCARIGATTAYGTLLNAPWDYTKGAQWQTSNLPSALAYWQNTTPTTTQFFLSGAADINTLGSTHIAVLMSDDSGDMYHGSYTGNGSASGPVVTIGFEPQWIMVKRTTASQLDQMRYPTFGPGNENPINRGTGAAQGSGNYLQLNGTTGFKVMTTTTSWNTNAAPHPFFAFR